jgi:hypothetical protein
MTGRLGRAGGWKLIAALLGAGGAVSGCGANGPTSADHNVYFEGNAFDGAGMGILVPPALKAVSIQYRDKLIKVNIDAAGRFTSQDPLPTWQDYMVTIAADGYRDFVSHNPGFEVPASLAAMQQGLSQISTTQTFDFDAYLFPVDLTAPAMTILVATVDDMTGNPGALGKASGTIRLRPTTQSTLQVGAVDTATATPRASRRVWANDNDLLTKTITMPFASGKYDVKAGDLVYGVQYEVTVYDVAGYQIYNSATDSKGSQNFVAGTVMTKTFQLTKVGKDPLRIISSTATSCTPPAPTSTTPGAQIVLTFSEPIEASGTTLAEDVDNGVSITSTPPVPQTYTVCPLKSSPDPTKQDRGTMVAISGAMMTFSFNPSVGLTAQMDPVSGFMVCQTPAAITSVTYGNLGLDFIQPMGDPTRKRLLSAMLQELNPTGLNTTSLSCPGH